MRCVSREIPSRTAAIAPQISMHDAVLFRRLAALLVRDPGNASGMGDDAFHSVQSAIPARLSMLLEGAKHDTADY